MDVKEEQEKGKSKMQYISFYDHELNKDENRAYSPAGRAITEYVAKVISDAGIKLQIISPICTKNRKGVYYKKEYMTPEGFSVVLPFSFGANNVIKKILKRIWQILLMYIFIIPLVEKNTTVLVYHSVSLTRGLSVLKKIKKVKIILQVEEIYADVTNNKKYRIREDRAFNIADGFIFPTKELERIVNKKEKPYVIVHGEYLEKKIKEDNKNKSNSINCVYAGTFDENKGGVFRAIEAARYLDEKFILHILGFGSEEESQKVKNKIIEIQSLTKCHIVYGGLKKGEEFDKYIQKCQIGLSTQNPEGNYNDTSFPSKVLMYMSNGLDVVSVDLPVLRESEVAEYIEYAYTADGIGIAKAIEHLVENGSKDCGKILNVLNKEFTQKLLEMIGEVENEI